MANDTLPSDDVKEDENSNVRVRQNSGREFSTCSSASSDVSGLRRSARDLLSKKRRASSPPSIRKSERLEKQISISPVRRASERVDKKLTPSPLRRSERGKHLFPSPSSGSKRGSDKSSCSSSLKPRKAKNEKCVQQLNLESAEVTDNEKHDLNLKVKSKRYDSRAYRSSFKNRKKKLEASERGEKQNRGSKLRKGGFASCRGKVNSIDECTERTMDELNEEHIRGACVEKKLECNGSGMVVSDLSLKPSCGEKDGDGVGVFRDVEGTNLVPSVATTKKINEPERMLADCSAAEKLKAPDIIDSSFSGRTLDDEIGSPKSQDILPSKRKMTTVDIDADVSLSNAKKRLNLDSTKHGSMCNTNLNHELSSAFRTQVNGKQGAGVTVGLAEKCDNDIQQKEYTTDFQAAAHQNTCFICKQGGKLLCCDGRGCNRSYHLECINHPMDDVPIGLWYCSQCIKNKIEFGAQSVSEGVESIWDAREVEVSEVDGIKRKEYFVKYKGLAHIHNCWVPESKLLLEAPSLVAKFNRKNQFTRLKPEWTVPQRLLQKRPLTLHKQSDQYPIEHSVDNLGFSHEWLVKWCGLDHKHATWELENSSIFNSPEGQRLICDFDNRLLKAKIENKKLDGESFSPELDQLPAGFSGSDNSNLDHINKLRKLWYEGKNAAIMDDQERIKKVVAFVMSLQSYVCQPFLIISTSSSLYSWYDEFLRLAPTINAVVYSGDKDSRRLIRKLEFYVENGCLMFQVLIATSEVIIEDLDVLADIGWETIVLDDFQRTRIPLRAKLKMLTTKMRLLLVSSPLKENTADYSSSLSLLDSDGGLDTDPSLNSFLDNFNKLKERFSRYVVFGWKSDSPRFKEYWVPVELSNVQLEQYCNTLISNATLLRSSLKGDIVGALCDMLRTVRKCCDHPYVINQKLQTKLIEGLPEVEWLDVGIKASGKLQLLDKMLLEIKRQGLRVLVIFQSISGSGRDSIGDILDDVMRQRFGPNSYEHVEASVNPPKKQAALNNFNNKECGRFVFLLDARACSPSIKLYSVDTVIIFGSDWNPMNDVKQLQKIKLYSPSEQIKIFRLYSSFTVEEKVLSLAKQGKSLDSNLQNVGRTTILSLLMWGASQLFEKLDKFHANNTLASCTNILPEESPLQDVVSGFLSILPHNGKDIDLEKSSIISNAQQIGGVYSSGSLLLGETKSQLVDEEQPHVFWTKLLEGKDPHWIYSSALPLGNRRRVQHAEDLLKKPEADNGEIIKKNKKYVSSCTESSSHELGSGGEVAASDKEGAASAINSPHSSPMSNVCPNKTVNVRSGRTVPHLDYNVCESSGASIFESEERRKLLDTQKSLYLRLKLEISKLCNILQLSDLAKGVADMFLMYMMHNHHVNRETVETLQAFLISVCWFAASCVKQKIDHKESLLLAREHLYFCCKKEDVEHQYSLLRCLKRVFLYRTGNLDAAVLPKSSSKDGMKDDLQESLTQLVSSDKASPSQLECSTEFKLAAKDILKSIKEIKKKCQKQYVKLVKIQKEEKNQIVREYEEEMAKLEKKHRLEEAVVLTLYPNNSSMRTDKLNVLKASQRRTLERKQHQIDMHFENLEIEQQAARNAMEEGEARWVEAVKSWAIGEILGKPPSNEPWQCMEYSQTKEHIICRVNAEDVIPVSGKVLIAETRAAASGDDQVDVISENPISQEQNSNHHMSSQMNVDVQQESKFISCHEVQPVTAKSDNNLSLKQADNDEHTLTSTTSGTHFEEAPASDEQNASQGQHVADAPVGNDLIASEISDHAGSQPAQAPGSNCTNHEAPSFGPAEQMVPFPFPISPPTCNLIDIASVDRFENEPSRDIVENESSRDNNASNQVSQVETPLVENLPESLNQDDLSGIPCAYIIEHELSRENNASNQVSQVPLLVKSSFEILNQAVLPDIPSVDCIENEPSGHASAQVSQAPRLVANSHEHSNQTVSHPLNSLSLHPSIDVPVGGLEAHLAETRMTSATGTRNHPTQTASDAVSHVPLPVFVDPLQNQLESLRKEAEQLHKFHVDKKLQLESDYEKEKAELEKKYELKFQEEDARYLSIKKENDVNQNIVLMNQILAEAFRSKCMDIRPSSNSVVQLQQDTNTSFMQQLAQVQQNAQRSSPLMGPSIALHNPASLPNLQTTSHAPVYTMASSSMTFSGSSSLFHDTSTRPLAPPPHIGSLSTPSTNVRGNSDLRAPAPHLQFNRPLAHPTVNHHQTHPHGMSSQHVNSNLPVTSDSLPPLPNQLPSSTYLTGSHSRSHIADDGLRILPNSSLSAVELFQDANVPPINFPPIPDVVPNIDRHNFSKSGTGTHTDPANRVGCNDVVCLSDDE